MATARRDFLIGGGAAVCLCGLAACSKSTTAEPAPGATGESSSAPSASGAESSKSVPTSSSSGESVGLSFPVGTVPEGGGIIMEDAKLVLTQPAKGEFRAFSSICPHQGCPVSDVEDQKIVCRCHGSEFSIKDGSVLHGPATSPLTEEPLTTKGDRILINKSK